MIFRKISYSKFIRQFQLRIVKNITFFFAYILEYVKKTIAKLPRNLSGAAGEYFSLQSKAFQIPVPQIVLRKQAKIVRINQ